MRQKMIKSSRLIKKRKSIHNSMILLYQYEIHTSFCYASLSKNINMNCKCP